MEILVCGDLTLVCGDIHGRWGPLNTLINKEKPNIVLQCGDFGWWPHYHNQKNFDGPKPWNQYGLKNKGTKVYWCPGNHENWDDLERIEASNNSGIYEIMDNVFYCSFGYILTLPDKRKVLFVGGAESIDKDTRIIGNSWWHQEIITYADMDKLPDEKIDIVISHTLPFQMACNAKGYQQYKWKIGDPSMKALDIVFEKYKPSLWYAGHFHWHEETVYRNCLFTVLNMPGNWSKWWVKLKGDKYIMEDNINGKIKKLYPTT